MAMLKLETNAVHGFACVEDFEVVRVAGVETVFLVSPLVIKSAFHFGK